MAALAEAAPSFAPESMPAAVSERSGFSIQGSMKEAAYDAFTGMIETYEGEAFALDQPGTAQSIVAAWQYPADFHYRCDELGSCSLVRSGVAVSARLVR